MTVAKSWPYCQGHPHCHDSRTRRYSRVGTNDFDGLGPIQITLGAEPDPRWGQLLCRAHALIIWGAA